MAHARRRRDLTENAPTGCGRGSQGAPAVVVLRLCYPGLVSETKQQSPKPAAAKKTAKKTANKSSDETFADLVKKHPELQEILAVQAAQSKLISDLQTRVGAMELVAPASMRAMSYEEIAKIAEEDPNFEFEVLEKWTFLGEEFNPGRRVCSNHYQSLLEFVRSGLRLGKPAVDPGQLFEDASVARIRAQAREYAEG